MAGGENSKEPDALFTEPANRCQKVWNGDHDVMIAMGEFCRRSLQ
jgi:hypothetical protein